MFGKKQIVDSLESLLRKTGYPDETICRFLRGFHVIFPNINGLLILFGNKKVVQLAILFNILVFCLFIIYNGCLLTRLEHRFSNDNYTVFDPFLNFLNIPLTHENRYTYSISSFIVCFIGSLIIYYYRFVYKSD
jgi:hypothetical protein